MSPNGTGCKGEEWNHLDPVLNSFNMVVNLAVSYKMGNSFVS
jgi:hypothetical protein